MNRDNFFNFYLFRFRFSNYFVGIFFSEGQTWFEQRRFALRNLRDFGFGRRQDELEAELQDEIQIMIDLLKNGPKYDFEKVVFFFLYWFKILVHFHHRKSIYAFF